MSQTTEPRKAAKQSSTVLQFPQPSLQLIYDTAPIGLAFLSPDCRYLQINQRLTEICGISVEDHLGRFVRDCVPALADAVEAVVQSIMETGEPVTGIEVRGQGSASARTTSAAGSPIGIRSAVRPVTLSA
jgi:PAS domain-containing protein